jgi:hypothetical protein
MGTVLLVAARQMEILQEPSATKRGGAGPWSVRQGLGFRALFESIERQQQTEGRG